MTADPKLEGLIARKEQLCPSDDDLYREYAKLNAKGQFAKPTWSRPSALRAVFMLGVETTLRALQQQEKADG